jgi:nucleoid-associated protein YgaU
MVAVSNPLKTEKATLTAKLPREAAGGGGGGLGAFVSDLASSAVSSFLGSSIAGGFQPGIAKVGKLVCKFNPKELTISQSARLPAPPNPAATGGTPAADYRGANAQTISMDLLFDEWEAVAGDVTPLVDMLLSWTLPVAVPTAEEPSEPPWVEFRWGKALFGTFHLKQASVKYTMFRKNGTPVRALATVTLQKIATEGPPPPTNPTSRGAPGWRTRMVLEGETLHSIAFQAYGHPKFWRGLADFNGIDDPLRVGVGSTLLIPPRSDVNGLS